MNLVRATIAGIEAVWSEAPGARIVHCDPIVNVAAPPERPDLAAEAEGVHLAQFQAWDMIAGRMRPSLSGDPKYLDVLGCNHYSDGQWTLHGPRLTPTDAGYRLLRHLLADVWARYGRPFFIAETGAEGDHRAPWLRCVGGEMRAALAAGVPVGGVCLYPVLDYPGWDDDRHRDCGLFGGRPSYDGPREVHADLADELARQQALLSPLLAASRRPVAQRGLTLPAREPAVPAG